MDEPKHEEIVSAIGRLRAWNRARLERLRAEYEEIWEAFEDQDVKTRRAVEENVTLVAVWIGIAMGFLLGTFIAVLPSPAPDPVGVFAWAVAIFVTALGIGKAYEYWTRRARHWRWPP